MKDKLDRINHDKALRSNLIKWWNVNMIEEDVVAEEEENAKSSQEISIMTEADKELVNRIVQRNDKSHVFEEAMYEVKEKEANEIYERLMREAMEDEAKKQAEIESARLQYTEEN